MKTSELTGSQLDWAAAKAEGLKVASNTPAGTYTQERGWFAPTTDWAQGGLIIEREFIATFSVEDRPFKGKWAADQYRHQQSSTDEDGDSLYSFYLGSLQYGPTPLIAAMRCFVASKLGDEVEIPEELL